MYNPRLSTKGFTPRPNNFRGGHQAMNRPPTEMRDAIPMNGRIGREQPNYSNATMAPVPGPHNQSPHQQHYHTEIGVPSRPPYNNNRGSFNSRPIHNFPPNLESPQIPITEDETIKFISETWLEFRDSNGYITYYQEKNPIQNANGFEPFDLRQWHMKRQNKYV